MTTEDLTKSIFKLYYHYNEIDSLLHGLNALKFVKSDKLAMELEMQKNRVKKVRESFDNAFGKLSEQYADDFDKLNEILENHFKITVKP